MFFFISFIYVEQNKCQCWCSTIPVHVTCHISLNGLIIYFGTTATLDSIILYAIQLGSTSYVRQSAHWMNVVTTVWSIEQFLAMLECRNSLVSEKSSLFDIGQLWLRQVCRQMGSVSNKPRTGGRPMYRPTALLTFLVAVNPLHQMRIQLRECGLTRLFHWKFWSHSSSCVSCCRSQYSLSHSENISPDHSTWKSKTCFST